MSLWSNQDASGAFPKYVPVGRILKIRVTAGGTGYTNGSSVAVTIGAPAANGVQAVATAVVSGGIVQSITLSNQGAKYTSTPSVTMATGTGLTVSVVREPVIYDNTKVVFVDATEAAQASNKSKGISYGGWWYVTTHQDCEGNTRYKSECLVAMGTAAATSGDREDAIVVDTSTTISFSLNPASQTISLGTATQVVFTSTAAVAPSGTATYQWQVAAVGSTKYVNIPGATSSGLTVTGLVLGDTGKRYRVKASATGAKDVTSTPATLTVTA